jgi:2'-5' RNA ligase
MRLFTAITLPEEIKKELSTYSDSIKSAAETGKFSNWRNYHVTLVFLGEVRECDLPKIKEIMEDAAAGFPPLYLRCTEIGYFSRKSRKILYYNVGGDTELLAKLQLYLYNGFCKSGLCKTQDGYTPHITFARQAKIEPVPEVMTDLPFSSGKITLMHSTRVDGRLTYLPIYESPFTGEFTVDRIEEGIAICERENKQFFSLPAAKLPEGAKDGSIIRYEGLKYTIDTQATAKRAEAIARKFNKEKRKPY